MKSPVRRARSTLLAGGTAAVAALLVTGCGGDDGETLRVYTGRHYDVELAFEQFSEETGIEVEFLLGNDAELREKIAAEGDETQADVYLTVDAGNLAAAADDGLFQSLDSPVLTGAIPAEYRDPDGQWFALAMRYRAIIYNTELLDAAEVPTTYAELADPQWQGRLCLRNSSNDYQQSLVASMIAADGEEQTLDVLEGWADNAEIFANDVAIIEAMAAGQCEIAVTNHYYLAQYLDEHPDAPIALEWPEQEGRGVHTNISGGGITRYADNPELAQQFLEWLATDGQDVFVASNFEYPANPDVAAVGLLVERFGTDFVRDDLAASELGSLNPEAVRLMDQANFG